MVLSRQIPPINRPELIDARATEAGGLSGKPLNKKANHVLGLMAGYLQGKVPIIAVGGVSSAADAKTKVELGASLVQLYTGFIYAGPALIADCISAVSKK